jgi:hypothetical protein
VIDEQSSHGLDRRSEKITTPGELGSGSEAKVGLVDQGGRLERVPGRLGRELCGSKGSDFVVDEHEEVGGAARVVGWSLGREGRIVHAGRVYDMVGARATRRMGTIQPDVRASSRTTTVDGQIRRNDRVLDLDRRLPLFSREETTSAAFSSRGQ